MPEYKAKGSLTVEGPDGSALSFNFITSRVQSYAELGAKVGASIQAQVDMLSSDQTKPLKDRITVLERQVAELEPKAPPPPVATEAAVPRRKARLSDGI